MLLLTLELIRTRGRLRGSRRGRGGGRRGRGRGRGSLTNIYNATKSNKSPDEFEINSKDEDIEVSLPTRPTY